LLPCGSLELVPSFGDREETMAKSSGQTFAKRQREIARREKRQLKAQRLRERRLLRAETRDATAAGGPAASMGVEGRVEVDEQRPPRP
jgi:hypothetical protein